MCCAEFVFVFVSNKAGIHGGVLWSILKYKTTLCVCVCLHKCICVLGTHTPTSKPCVHLFPTTPCMWDIIPNPMLAYTKNPLINYTGLCRCMRMCVCVCVCVPACGFVARCGCGHCGTMTNLLSTTLCRPQIVRVWHPLYPAASAAVTLHLNIRGVIMPSGFKSISWHWE